MTSRRILSALGISLGMAALATAAAQTRTFPLPPEYAKDLAVLGPNVVGKALPAPRLDSPRKYFPLQESEWSLEVTSGASKGTVKTYRLTAEVVHESSTDWVWELPGEETLYLLVSSEDSMGVSSQLDQVESIITTFDPPERILDSELQPGQTRERKLSVRVFDLHKPEKEKYSGKLDARETYVGAYEVLTPAGRFEAVLMRTEYDGKIGPAKVVDVSYRFFAEGVGIVATISHQRLSAMLFYKKDTKFSLVLLDGPRPLGAK